MVNDPDTKSPHVPGQYLGYSLQTTRCLARLLDAPTGSFVSIEVFEDVGVEMGNGRRIAEQNKSTLDGNPVSNRSKDLWKTFSNWVDAAKTGELDPEKTQFEIYVSQAVSGSIVEKFHKATTFNDANAALVAARDELWGKAPGFPKKPSVANTIASYVSNFLESDASEVSKIVQAFSLCTGGGSPHRDLQERMLKMLTPEEILDAALKYALGCVKIETDLLLEQGKPAIVSVDKFRRTLTEYIRKNDRRSILATYASNPDQLSVQNHLQYRTYVKQLELIEADPEMLEEAVIDFLRAAVDRTYWSTEGYIDQESLEEYEQNLVRVWKNTKRKALVTVNTSECAQGKLLYAECSGHKAKIAGLEVPAHFTPGSFHALADESSIGWHPNYDAELRKPQDESEE